MKPILSTMVIDDVAAIGAVSCHRLFIFHSYVQGCRQGGQEVPKGRRESDECVKMRSFIHEWGRLNSKSVVVVSVLKPPIELNGGPRF